MGFRFPPWTNHIRALIALGAIGAGVYVFLIINFGFSPRATDRNYQPVQPVPFSHRLHSGELGMDCRYCHNSVERQMHSPIPPTETCIGCHNKIHTQSVKLQVVRDSWENDTPIPWARVHDLPDYSYFNHSAHVLKGVGCASCHGRVDQMEVVYQYSSLSMGWCLQCHRNPEPNLRPLDKITQMDWQQESPEQGARLKAEYNVNPNDNCSTCHR